MRAPVSCFWQVPQEPSHLLGVQGQPETELCDQLGRSQWGRDPIPSPFGKDLHCRFYQESAEGSCVIYGLDSKVTTFQAETAHRQNHPWKIPYFAWLQSVWTCVFLMVFTTSTDGNWDGNHWDRLQGRAEGEAVMLCIQILLLLTNETCLWSTLHLCFVIL